MLQNERRKIFSESLKILSFLNDAALRNNDAYLERLEKEFTSNRAIQEKMLKGKASSTEQRDHIFSQSTSLHDVYEISRNSRNATLLRSKTVNQQLAMGTALLVLIAIVTGFFVSRRTNKLMNTEIGSIESTVKQLNCNCSSLASASQSLQTEITAISKCIEKAAKHLSDSTNYHEETSTILLQIAHNILEASKSANAISYVINPNEQTNNTNPFHIKQANTNFAINVQGIAERQIISAQLIPLQHSISTLSELANKQANIANQAVSTKDDNDIIIADLIQRKFIVVDKAAKINHKTEEFTNALHKAIATLTGKLSHE
jgi:hypothetical protein